MITEVPATPSATTGTSATVRRVRRRLLAAAGAALSVLLGCQLLAPSPAAADSAVLPQDGTFTLNGAGFGHGWGMSQYGAEGAARQGLSWQQILNFYYPGTTLSSLPKSTKIRVWITADYDHDTRVVASPGLKVLGAGGTSLVLPTGSSYAYWRIMESDSALKLKYRSATGSWKTLQTTLTGTSWGFENTAKIVAVQLPNGTVRELRGRVSAVLSGGVIKTVNRLTMEQYLQSVVPSEMPTSWDRDAVATQAVAARSFAARTQANTSSRASYDVCDTTACQVYSGYATVSGGRRTIRETAAGNAAVAATAGQVLKYGSTIAFTQFASSNGGHTAQGDFPYLSAHPDPYDGVVVSNAWSRKITAATVARVWPSVGTVRQLQVTVRDGAGRYGGRVKTIKIIGSNSTLSVSGGSFQSVFGLRSTLFTITGAVPPAAAPVAKVTTTGSCVDGGGITWKTKAVWGSTYTGADGIKRVRIDYAGWTTRARTVATDSTVRSYTGSGVRLQTLNRTRSLDYRLGTVYDARNPLNPPSAPGKAKIRISVGKDRDGKPRCTVTHVQPKQ
ncbi:SpoIID/LytB domain protein [Microlunatus panaciterrae]|uniref:SpoIID/LytB domain protein n=1 Tax=Microlunatus panaciterrae TaxID=400768 RepID=A0ABS2RNY1_9ACTN|nr:SpoIID/LytB domain-containing protein [Microlunatus panaciterrae]MBM7800721.1 SpoIID/LytB domain protein [Microlunatus panaciterrae]